MDQDDESPADRPRRVIDCRTIGGHVYLRSADVQTALKVRAGEYEQLRKDAETDPAVTDPVQRELFTTVYAAIAIELNRIAEKHQFADIELLEGNAADSVIHTPCTNCGADIEVCPVCGAKQE